MSLDAYDKLLLLALDKNCRASFSEIGRSMRRSPQFVKYRFEQLVEQRVIQHLHVAVNPLYLGYQTLHYFIKLQGIALAEEQLFLEYLYKHSLINTVERTEGYYDYHISFCAKDLTSFANLLQDITHKFGKYFSKFDNVNDLSVQYFDKTYLTERKQETTKQGVKQELTQTDRKVFSKLVAHPRKRIVDISQDLNLPLSAVRTSLSKITSLVERYSFILDPRRIDQHIVLFRLKDFSEEQERKFIRFANLHMNITHYARTYGSWHMLLYVEIDDRAAFRRLLREIQFTFSESIEQVETCTIYQIDKYRTFPIEYPYQ